MRVLAAGIFLALLLAARPVAAFHFSPSAVDVLVTPGADGVATFHVANDSSASASYVASIYGVDFAEDGAPIFSPLAIEYATWFALDAYNFTLSAGASRDVLLRVATPQETPSTALTVAVVVRELAQNTGVTVSTGFSGLAFITVGTPQAEATFEGLTTPSMFVTGLPVDFIATFRNNGVQTLQPTGSLVVRNTFGFERHTATFNPTGGRVLAGHERAFVTTWEEGARTATGLVALWRKIADVRIGVFTAELNVIPYPGADAVRDVARVIVLPWSAMIVVLGVGCVLALAVRRRNVRR